MFQFDFGLAKLRSYNYDLNIDSKECRQNYFYLFSIKKHNNYWILKFCLVRFSLFTFL